MKLKLTTIIRYIFTALLVYGVYTETGIYTAFFAAGVSFQMEFNDKQLKIIQNAFTKLDASLECLWKLVN